MLCADAKNVTAGIDTKGGDVDMFGHERNGKLTERKERLFNDIEKIDENKNSLNMNPDGETREDIVPQLKTAIERISTRLADTRDLAVKQTFGLNKFKGMGGYEICICHKWPTGITVSVRRIFS